MLKTVKTWSIDFSEQDSMSRFLYFGVFQVFNPEILADPPKMPQKSQKIVQSTPFDKLSLIPHREYKSNMSFFGNKLNTNSLKWKHLFSHPQGVSEMTSHMMSC
jgi:hypothetical protein